MCRVAAVEKAEAEKLQVVMAAQGDAEAKYLQGQAWRLSLPPDLLLPAYTAPALPPVHVPEKAAHA